jgi:aldose sugar dehydrogenase
MQAKPQTKLHYVIRLIAHFAATVGFAAILGSLAQTQLNLRHLPGFGVAVDWATRLQSTLADLVHFAPTLALLLAAAFAIAFAVNDGISRLRKGSSRALTVLAGAMAVLVMLVAMRHILGLQPIASARDTLGLACFTACGALSGGLFALLRKY